MRAHASHWLVMHTHVSMQWITSVFQKVSVEGKAKFGSSSLSSVNLETDYLPLTFLYLQPSFSQPVCVMGKWPLLLTSRLFRMKQESSWAKSMNCGLAKERHSSPDCWCSGVLTSAGHQNRQVSTSEWMVPRPDLLALFSSWAASGPWHLFPWAL